MNVEADIWDMKNGEITALRMGAIVYRVEHKTPLHNVKECYLRKWIHAHNIKVFTLDQFFKEYPKQRERMDHLEINIAKMISDKELLQIGKNKFKVNI